jgi:trigger factor
LSKVKNSGAYERLVTMTLSEDEILAGRTTAARRLAKELRIKGFRPGKAPVKVVESAVGKAKLREEAIEDALQKAVGPVLEEHELSPVIPPRLSDLRDEGGEVEVEVLVTLWPKPKKNPKFEGRKVPIDLPEVTDTDVDDQIDRMRHQFAELEDVSREGFDGDYVTIDVSTTLDGDEFAPGSATDLLFEIGSGSFLQGLDDALKGVGAGGIVSFESVLPDGIGEHAGRDVSVRALVKQVKAKRLPELNDEWVSDVSEFDNVDELRSELREQIEDIRRRGAWRQVEDKALADMLDDLKIDDLPEALVEAEMESVFHRFVHRLEEQGVGFDQYLQLSGQDQEAFLADLRSQADLNLRSRIMLEAIAEDEGIEVTAAELDGAVTALAGAARIDVDEYRKALSEGGRVMALAGDILRRKVIDRILDSVIPVDGDGSEVELPPRRAEEDTGADGEDADEAVPDDDESGLKPAEVDE